MNAQVQSEAPEAPVAIANAPESVVVDNTRPYAWPYDHRLTTMNFAFVVVTGSAAGANGQPADHFVASCRTFADRIGEFGARVVWVACSGSSAPAVAIDGELTVDSPTANGFIGSNLELVLRSNGIDRFALAGWPLEIAVHSTMRRANDLGYECLLLEDLCVPMDEKLQRSSISQILMSGGIFGAVGLSGDLADAMAQSHPTQSAATTGQGAESQ